MPKDKTKAGVPNKHVHARISFLHQAATYLTLRRDEAVNAGATSAASPHPQASLAGDAPHDLRVSSTDMLRRSRLSRGAEESGLPNLLNSHLRQIALKSQIRLHPTVKHRVCKVCSTTLVEGQTCCKAVENNSRSNDKPHADVLVMKCTKCGTAKRFPIGAQRQQPKSKRLGKKVVEPLAEDANLDARASEPGPAVAAT